MQNNIDKLIAETKRVGVFENDLQGAVDLIERQRDKIVSLQQDRQRVMSAFIWGLLIGSLFGQLGAMLSYLAIINL